MNIETETVTVQTCPSCGWNGLITKATFNTDTQKIAVWFKCPRCQRENIQRLVRNERSSANTAQNKWAAAVKYRDGGKCVICGATADLHAHHIVPKEYCSKLRYDVNNGVTLCREHHDKVHRYDCERRALLRRACSYLKKNNTTDESARLLDDIVSFGRMLEMEKEANI